MSEREALWKMPLRVEPSISMDENGIDPDEWLVLDSEGREVCSTNGRSRANAIVQAFADAARAARGGREGWGAFDGRAGLYWLQLPNRPVFPALCWRDEAGFAWFTNFESRETWTGRHDFGGFDLPETTRFFGPLEMPDPAPEPKAPDPEPPIKLPCKVERYHAGDERPAQLLGADGVVWFAGARGTAGQAALEQVAAALNANAPAPRAEVSCKGMLDRLRAAAQGQGEADSGERLCGHAYPQGLCPRARCHHNPDSPR